MFINSRNISLLTIFICLRLCFGITPVFALAGTDTTKLSLDRAERIFIENNLQSEEIFTGSDPLYPINIIIAGRLTSLEFWFVARCAHLREACHGRRGRLRRGWRLREGSEDD